jgi:hypothetical protein
MTNPLEILKTQLEKALDETIAAEDFTNAVIDGVYACGLSEIALTTWMDSWVSETAVVCLSESEIQYQQGVQFVEEKWHQITGMF